MLSMEMQNKVSKATLSNKLRTYTLPIVFTSSTALGYLYLKAQCAAQDLDLCSSEGMVITTLFASLVVTLLASRSQSLRPYL